jgi:hypothetical protein
MCALALASPSGTVIGGPAGNVRDTPLAEILRQSAVVIEGPVIETRTEIWMGPSNHAPMLIWRVAVEEEILGHVESGVIDLVVSDEWPPVLDPGERVMVMANLRTLYLPTYLSGRMERFEVFPAYDDLLVLTVYGSLYHTRTIRNEDGTINEEYWSSPVTQTGADWLPEDREERHRLAWDEILRRVRAAAATCAGCGATVAGATAETP